MARSQNSFIKMQREKKKQMKKKEKEQRKQERKENNSKGADLADMMAYLDEDGNIISAQKEETVEKEESSGEDQQPKP